jgi:hypothetical protein
MHSTNGSSRARTVWIWSEREADEEAGDSSFVCLSVCLIESSGDKWGKRMMYVRGGAAQLSVHLRNFSAVKSEESSA